MSTLEEQRRATGRRIVEERKATGRAIVERRTGRADALDINAVVDRPRQRGTLRTIEPRGAIAPQRGRGEYKAPAGGGGGIASPLVEQPDTREYYPAVLRPSSDGAVFFEVRAAKKVTLTDANGETVVLEFANVTS